MHGYTEQYPALFQVWLYKQHWNKCLSFCILPRWVKISYVAMRCTAYILRWVEIKPSPSSQILGCFIQTPTLTYTHSHADIVYRAQDKCLLEPKWVSFLSYFTRDAQCDRPYPLSTLTINHMFIFLDDPNAKCNFKWAHVKYE